MGPIEHANVSPRPMPPATRVLVAAALCDDDTLSVECSPGLDAHQVESLLRHLAELLTASLNLPASSS